MSTYALRSFFKPGASLAEAALVYASQKLFVFPTLPDSKKPLPRSGGWHDAESRPDVIKHWWNTNPNCNVGIALRYSNLAVIDVDPRNGGDRTLDDLVAEFGPLPPTYTVRTGGGGYHFYYRVDESFYEDAEFPKKFAEGVELLTNHYVLAPPSHVDGKNYVIAKGIPTFEEFAIFPHEWMRKVVSSKKLHRFSDHWHPDSEDWYIEKGERDNTMAAIAGWARRMGSNEQEIASVLEAFLDRFEDPEEMRQAIPRIARGMMRYAPDRVRFNDLRVTMKTRRKVPELAKHALWGPIGEWVRTLEPRTESHPATLMTQALCAFGNIIGAKERGAPAPGFEVGDTYHNTGLYAVLVGDTAKAGKGDSWAHVRKLMKYVDPKWDTVSGVQTGEGLIDALADDQPTGEHTTIKKKGEKGESVEHVQKGGLRDRRYFIIEPEFGRTLHTGGRVGSTLKDILRDLWDTGSTKKVTAGSKQTVTGATVSLVGHITKAELDRDFDPVDLMSGFGNRFLYVFAKRIRILPDERPLSAKQFQRFSAPLRDAVKFAQNEAPTDYGFSDEAWDLWEGIVGQIQKAHANPLIDALGARARPMLRRMAVIFAVADCSDVIELEHLEAAWALWDYSAQTLEYVFGTLIGDRDADLVFRLLAEHRAGLSISDFYQVNTNISKARWLRALTMLSDRGLVHVRKEKRKRKTIEVYFINPDTL